MTDEKKEIIKILQRFCAADTPECVLEHHAFWLVSTHRFASPFFKKLALGVAAKKKVQRAIKIAAKLQNGLSELDRLGVAISGRDEMCALKNSLENALEAIKLPKRGRDKPDALALAICARDAFEAICQKPAKFTRPKNSKKYAEIVTRGRTHFNVMKTKKIKADSSGEFLIFLKNIFMILDITACAEHYATQVGRDLPEKIKLDGPISKKHPEMFI